MSDHTDRDALASAIATQLEISQQYREDLSTKQVDRIKLVRSAGRQAGRLLGWKVRTFQTDPAGDEGLISVIVVVVESTPEDEARFRTQGNLLIRDAFRRGAL